MSGILLLGLLIGMQHAMEADHVAAVSSIATGSRSVRRIATHGAVWGFGHTLTLVAVTGAVIILGTTLNKTLTLGLELAVGIMLILLGGHVLYRLWRERIHFHSHRHGDGSVHFHAHSHRGEPARHDPANHDHRHARGLPWRTLLVGMTHGMAGSAALLILTASTVGNPVFGMYYVLLFGIGSMAGMVVLSALIAVPLTWTARALTGAHHLLQGAVGTATVGLGIAVIVRTVGGLLVGT